MSIFGALIGAAGSIFGGRQKTTSSVDYVKMRKNAEEAGFNPLTALQNGGAAGFTRTSGPPALSSTEAIANVLGTAADTWFNRDKIAADAEKERLEVALMRQELANMQKPSEVVRDRDFGYSIPQVSTSSGADYANSGPPLAVNVPAGGGARPAGRSGRDLLGGPIFPNWSVDTSISTADDWANEYGDVVEAVVGGYKLLRDTGQNLNKKFFGGRGYQAVFPPMAERAPPRRPDRFAPDFPPLSSDVAPPRQDEWFQNYPSYQ